MPLVYQQNINEHTKLAVWHILEDEDFFLNKVPLNKDIGHPHKRLQHLAARFSLRELFEDFPLELILIADTKKPFLADEAYHFSISHCGDYAAVIVSGRSRVGVDIEIVSSKVETIQHKFLSAREQEMIDRMIYNTSVTSKTQILTLTWSIKETMYKWYGKGAVDFKGHLVIENIEFHSNEFVAHCIFNKDASVQLVVKGLLFNGNIVTWLVT